MNVSQNAIAKLTGFSRSTVSRALANHPAIPAETKDIIQKAAETAGYRTNPLVSLLTAQIRQSRAAPIVSTIGYITTFPHAQIEGTGSGHYGELYLGAKARAEALGYNLDIIWRHEGRMSAERFDRILAARGIKGVVIAPRPNPLSHIRMDYSRVACAAIGHPLPSPHVNHTSAWHSQIMSLAIRQIKKKGYQRLGYAIFPDSDGYSNHDFYSRFLLYNSQVPETFRVPMLSGSKANQPATLDDFRAWFSSHRPDAIICAGPVIPAWLEKLGLVVPRDIAFADIALTRVDSGTSGVYERTRMVGAFAVDLVVEQIHQNSLGVPQIPKCIHVEGQWVDGFSLPVKRVARI